MCGRAEYLRPMGWVTHPWRGVLGGWRTRDEQVHGLRLRHHLRRACHHVALLAERQRDSQLAYCILGAMREVRRSCLQACNVMFSPWGGGAGVFLCWGAECGHACRDS